MCDAASMVAKAMDAYAAGLFHDALAQFHAVIAKHGESALGPAMLDLGVVSRHCGRLRDASRYYAKARRAVTTAHERHILMNNFAVVLLDKADFQAAERRFKILLVARPQQAWDYLMSEAAVWMELGRYALVCAALRQAVNSANAFEADLDYAMVRLSPAPAALGLRDLARNLARKGLARKRLYLPAHHGRLHIAGLFAAQTSLRCHRYDEARLLMEESLPALVRAFGESSPWVLRGRLIYSEALLDTYSENSAQTHLEAAFALLSSLGWNRPETVTALRLWGRLRPGADRTDHWLREALALADHLGLTDTHWDRVALHRAQCMDLLARQRPAEAAAAWMNYDAGIKRLQQNRLAGRICPDSGGSLADTGRPGQRQIRSCSSPVSPGRAWQLLVVSDDAKDSRRIWAALPESVRQDIRGKPRGVAVNPHAIRHILRDIPDWDDVIGVIHPPVSRHRPSPGVNAALAAACPELRAWLAASPADIGVRLATLRCRWTWLIGDSPPPVDTDALCKLDPDQPDRDIFVLPDQDHWPRLLAAQLAQRIKSTQNVPCYPDGHAAVAMA